MATSRMSMASRTRKAWSAGHMLDLAPRAADRLGHAHGLYGLGHVVGTDQMGAAEHGGGRRGQRAGKASSGIGLARDLADEGFARGADAHRPAEDAQAPDLREDRTVPLVPRHVALPEEADAWIDHDALWLDAGPGGDLEALREHLDDGVHGRGGLARAHLGGHHDEASARARHERREARILRETTHVVDDGGAGFESSAGWPHAARVGGDGHSELARDVADGRAEAIGLLGGGDGVREIRR